MLIEGTRYDSQINVTYTGIGITEEQIVVIESIDRVPSQERLTFTDLTQGSDAVTKTLPQCWVLSTYTYFSGVVVIQVLQVSVGNTRQYLFQIVLES